MPERSSSLSCPGEAKPCSVIKQVSAKTHFVRARADRVQTPVLVAEPLCAAWHSLARPARPCSSRIGAPVPRSQCHRGAPVLFRKRRLLVSKRNSCSSAGGASGRRWKEAGSYSTTNASSSAASRSLSLASEGGTSSRNQPLRLGTSKPAIGQPRTQRAARCPCSAQ